MEYQATRNSTKPEPIQESIYDDMIIRTSNSTRISNSHIQQGNTCAEPSRWRRFGIPKVKASMSIRNHEHNALFLLILRILPLYQINPSYIYIYIERERATTQNSMFNV